MLIRSWSADDRGALILMALDCLGTNFAAGADMLPTPKNAVALVDLGYQAVAAGDPCLVADDGDGPVGYTLWLGMPNALGLEYHGKVLYGLGTYVVDAFRRHGVSNLLRNSAESRGRSLGYTKVVGVAYHDVGLKSVLARGYVVAGQHVEKEL